MEVVGGGFTKDDFMNFRKVRRQDRLWEEGEAKELLEAGEFGFLAMCAPEGYGYGLPMSYVYRRERNCIYFHCAREGHKIDAIGANDGVSFCVVGKTRVVPYSTGYESVLVFGRIAQVTDEGERWEALVALREKYNPELGPAPEEDAYIRRSFDRTAVLRLKIEHLQGKCKRVR